MENKNTSNNNIKNVLISFFIVVGFFIILFSFVWNWISGIFSVDSNDNRDKIPDEIELMSYAQTVLDDNLYEPKYSSYKGDYTFIGTGLRYKIEGDVILYGDIKQKFYMIIEFVDERYEEYDLISLQVGDKKIY